MIDMFEKIIAICGLLISIITCLWTIRCSRIKIFHRYFGNYIIGNSDQFTSVCEFDIVNAGSRPISIVSISYSLKEIKGAFYSFGRSTASFPILLEHSEYDTYTVDYKDINNLIKNGKAAWIKLTVIDSLGKKYKTKWIRLKRFAKNYGHISEMDINKKACLFMLGKDSKKYKLA